MTRYVIESREWYFMRHGRGPGGADCTGALWTGNMAKAAHFETREAAAATLKRLRGMTREARAAAQVIEVM